MEQRIGDWIETFTGGQFWPLDPRPEDVNIIDIAHSLSMQCRFNGHTRVFYSVAEHSIIVAKEIIFMGYGPLSALYGLLHDAAEAYICDLPRPIKSGWGWYAATENQVLSAILKAFDLPMPKEKVWKMIKLYDNLLLGYEGRKLMRNTAGWASSIDTFQPRTLPVGLSHSIAKQQFLSMFADLIRELNGNGNSGTKP